MRRKLLTVLAVLLPLLALTASYVYAQEEPPPVFDLTDFVPPIIAAAAPLLAYIAVFFAKRYVSKIPKMVLVLIPTALGILIGVVEKLAGGDGSVIMISLWANLSIVLHELQQKFAEWASGGDAKSVALLFKKTLVG